MLLGRMCALGAAVCFGAAAVLQAMAARTASALAVTGVVCAGLAMLGLTSGTEGDKEGPDALRFATLGVALAVLGVGLAGGRLRERGRGLVLGLAAGFGFGVGRAAAQGSTRHSASKVPAHAWSGGVP